MKREREVMEKREGERGDEGRHGAGHTMVSDSLTSFKSCSNNCIASGRN